jgi:hypothetical protein
MLGQLLPSSLSSPSVPFSLPLAARVRPSFALAHDRLGLGLDEVIELDNVPCNLFLTDGLRLCYHRLPHCAASLSI